MNYQRLAGESMHAVEISSGKPESEAKPRRTYGMPLTEELGVPHADAVGITEELIRSVVDEFYLRARRDEELGPIFNAHIHDWDVHLARMADFWSAALLRTGRFSGQPVQKHWTIPGLHAGHFDRWVALFDETVRDICSPREAEAFVSRAMRMRDAMTKTLGMAPLGPRATG